jgi:hypothetical protein
MTGRKVESRPISNGNGHASPNLVRCPCCGGAGTVILPDHDHVSARIAWFRKMRGLDQQGLADLVSRSRAQISNIESGRYGLPVNQLPVYAEALGVVARDLVP